MPYSRIVCWVALFTLIGWDILCVCMGWPTISSQMRKVDKETGTLFRWAMLAVWLHWFVGKWPRYRS